MEAENGSWSAPLLRSALLLTGDPARAAGLVASALTTHGDTQVAYFILYRRFLWPPRRWSRPSWAGSLTRREVAIVVAGVHDGWPVEDVADLVGRSPSHVRRVLGEQSYSAETLHELAGSPDVTRIATVTEEGNRRGVRSWIAALIALSVAIVIAFVLLPEDDGPAAAAWPVPTPAYTPPTAADLPRTLRSPLAMGYPLDDPYDEYESRDLWHVVDTAGVHWVVRDANPDDRGLQISPDGTKLAYNSLRHHGPVVADLVTGELLPINGDAYAVNAFSLDGRHLARWMEDDEKPQVKIIDLERPESPKVYRNVRFGGWTSKGAILIAEDRTLLARPGRAAVRVSSFSSGDPVRVSADGRLAASGGDELVIVDLPSGKTLRRFPLPELTRVTLHRWLTPTSILVELLRSDDGADDARLFEVDIRTGKLTQLEADLWTEVPRAFGIR
ncbi:hypothetical protein ACIBG8_20595 [Nonomuraea sp. NPDC050556]|uniref:hypothetical protein n=1 Tax=Nonomuraea sp. NPDC050556 TaxID=3364369 RepID=UPI0037B9E44F